MAKKKTTWSQVQTFLGEVLFKGIQEGIQKISNSVEKVLLKKIRNVKKAMFRALVDALLLITGFLLMVIGFVYLLWYFLDPPVFSIVMVFLGFLFFMVAVREH